VDPAPLTGQAAIPLPTPVERRTAAEQYQGANQWLVAGRPDKAVPILMNCCRLDPHSMIYRQSLRSAQRQLGRARGPISLLKKWRAIRRMAKASRAGKWIAVLGLAENVLTLDPGDVRAHRSLAKAFETLGLLDRAVWCLEQAAQGHHHDQVIAAELARLYERTGQFSRVNAVAKSPSTAEIASEDWQQQLLDELDRFRQDAAKVEQKLAQEPENQELQGILARLRHEIQAREIEQFRQATDRHPADMVLKLEFGILLLKAGQFEAALEAFQAARSDEPLAWRAVYYAAYCHLNLRQWRQAKPLFQEALTLIPPEAAAARQEVLALLNR
jgi:tetratricopeptide (TPR) repeat protein